LKIFTVNLGSLDSICPNDFIRLKRRSGLTEDVVSGLTSSEYHPLKSLKLIYDL